MPKQADLKHWIIETKLTDRSPSGDPLDIPLVTIKWGKLVGVVITINQTIIPYSAYRLQNPELGNLHDWSQGIMVMLGEFPIT